MKLNLEILQAAYLYDEKVLDNLNTKKLVPNMMFRRRLTSASKIVVELMNMVQFSQGRILYGTSFGELKATANILDAILNEQMLSPTDFQNSVYNTAVSYASILKKNKSEILTISSGDDTSLKVLKAGAIKALDGDEILLICTESLNIKNIEQVNKCNNFLECGVALKVRITQESQTMDLGEGIMENLPKSILDMYKIAKSFKENCQNIVEIEI